MSAVGSPADQTAADPAETDIAIVGIGGHFPGAPDVDTLWRRVVDGDDCLVDLDEPTLRAAGVPERRLNAPNYVRRNGVLDDVELFDAEFFGVGKRDAAIMDPQHRHFIECVWEALESSGHVPERFPGAIGLFAGCGMNTYMLNNLLTNPKLVDQVGMFLLRHTGNDKDFLTTTVSYRLNLTGPSINVQTACSTSLVAVHLAVQSLLSMECDLALAGGSTIEVPHRQGYLYEEGEILAPDGVCRAFDARSGGTVLTSGAGVVALRRLQDALDDGDPVLAVVKSSAVNNDGQRKVGYLAPSVDGHADVIKEALAVSGLSARDIQLFEAHGTGTAVGDPIEVAAATEAYRASTDDTQYCRLVSTKPNIGHLDTAAGVASLIKVVQAMRHRTLPPLANHTAPSPLLDLERSPFVLAADPAPWPGDAPRRAGISSLGVGGTNAHVIVEEAPPRPATPVAVGEQVLLLSARNKESLDAGARRLADLLEAEPDLNLADVSYTLARGRRQHGLRRVVVAADPAQAVEVLRGNDRNRATTTAAETDHPPRVTFMFPGGGSQYNGMAAGLDDRFEVFREVMREGIAGVAARSGIDLEPLLDPQAAPDALSHPTTSLPAVFLTSVAMARQWMAWGVTPDALLGHSLGEYAAAHLSGVLTLDGALDLIVARAELMEKATGTGAAMLAVPLPEADVIGRLPDTLSLATVNAPDECVVSGPEDDIIAFKALVDDDERQATLIPLSAAAHSSMLDPVLPDFLAVVGTVTLSEPTIPYLSNLTGSWITAEQATSPQYWVDHLRHTVRFSDDLATLLDDRPTVLVEMGPGHSLSSYARRQPVKPVAAIGSLRHPNQDVDDTAAALGAFARSWAAGVDTDIAPLAGPGRRKVRLPGYAFARDRHWIEPGDGRVVEAAATTAPTATITVDGIERITRFEDSFWAPGWRTAPDGSRSVEPRGPWLIVGDPGDPLARGLADAITARTPGEIVEVVAAPDPARLGAARSIVLTPAGADPSLAAERWLHVAAAAARALAQTDLDAPLLAAVTVGATDADGPASAPVDALSRGVLGVAPREYPGLSTVVVDLDSSADPTVAVEEIFRVDGGLIARRGARRLVPELEPLPGDAPARSESFRQGGSYVITGGLGGVGFALARHLLATHDARIAVVASRAVPTGADADAWLARHGYDDTTSRRIRRHRELEGLGAVTLLTADLADPTSVTTMLDAAADALGGVDGVVHAAGQLHDVPIEIAERSDLDVVIGAKAVGALTLVEEMGRRGGGLVVLVSSTSTTLMSEGQAAYVAANAVLDALAGVRDGVRVATINYGLWSEFGVAAETAHRALLGLDAGEPWTHPVLSTVHRERHGDVQVSGVLSAQHHWVVDEHRSADGVALLPGTAHLELYLAALAAAHGAEASAGVELSDISLYEPLVVGDDHPVTVRVLVTTTEHGAGTLELASDGGGGAWRAHGVATYRLGAAPPPVPSEPAAIGEQLDPMTRPASQLQLGPRWRLPTAATRSSDAVTGTITMSAPVSDERDLWFAHPAVVDIATAFGVAMGDRADSLYVPVGYDRVTRFGAIPPTSHVEARVAEGSSTDLLRVDITLRDDAGNLALRLGGLALRPIDDVGSLGARPDEVTVDTGRLPPLLTLAMRHGIAADEGAAMVERLVSSGRSRLIASSIDIGQLTALTASPVPPPGEAGEQEPASGASVEAVLLQIWVDLLGVDDIGPDDDFFDAGGHSLIAIRLMSRIAKDLGVRFQLATIFEAPTVSSLAALIRDAKPTLDAELAAAAGGVPTPAGSAAAAPTTTTTGSDTTTTKPSLVTISASGDGQPLFIVHGAGGNVLFLWSLARALSGTRPVYGFQAHGVDGDDMPDDSIEEMARRYVTELRSRFEGPYLLGGYSGGGIVTFEMVRQLEELGEQVEFLILFDSVPPGKAAPSSGVALRNLIGSVTRHGLPAIMPFIKRSVKGWAGRFIPTNRFREIEHEGVKRELGMGDPTELGFVNLFYYFTAAADRYEMTTIHVDAVVLKAEWVWPTQPDDYYWGRHIDGDLEVREVPGDHNEMFFPEHAPRLAAVLREVLEARGI
ncbi:MAG: type I polyketide synthase [Desertimonas sp.]